MGWITYSCYPTGNLLSPHFSEGIVRCRQKNNPPSLYTSALMRFCNSIVGWACGPCLSVVHCQLPRFGITWLHQEQQWLQGRADGNQQSIIWALGQLQLRIYGEWKKAGVTILIRIKAPFREICQRRSTISYDRTTFEIYKIRKWRFKQLITQNKDSPSVFTRAKSKLDRFMVHNCWSYLMGLDGDQLWLGQEIVIPIYFSSVQVVVYGCSWRDICWFGGNAWLSLRRRQKNISRLIFVASLISRK